MSTIPPLQAAAPAVASPERQMEKTATWLDISSTSPLYTYEPERNAPGVGWSQDIQGGSSCTPSAGGTYAVGIEAIYFSEITFLWTAHPDYTVSVGLDGQLQQGPGSTGVITLNAQAGVHAIRLEASSTGATPGTGTVGVAFQFLGVKVNTATASGVTIPSNQTIDDADALVQYTGFTSSPAAAQSQVPDLQGGSYYMKTISYTSSAQASASLLFTGSSIYVYGPTGPSFNSFQITLDSQPYSSKSNGIFNASSTVTTASTLLFYATQLDPSSQHQITLTNQVDGATLAVDYFVVGSAQTQPQQTPVWPGGQGQPIRGNDTSGALVGGILGGLLAALLLFFAFMYWRWKKKGGKGNFWVAFCGPVRKALKVETKEESTFRPWPMLYYRPKYAVDD